MAVRTGGGVVVVVIYLQGVLMYSRQRSLHVPADQCRLNIDLAALRLADGSTVMVRIGHWPDHPEI